VKLDLRKTALLAAVTMGFVCAQCVFMPLWVMATGEKVLGSPVSAMVGNLLLGAPLPIMLALLYKTRITPAISCKMRFLALATAVVAGIFEALPRIIDLLQVVYQSLPYVHFYEGETEAARLGRWLYHFYGPYVWEAVILLSYLSIILFLVFLTLGKGNLPSGDERPAHMVRRTALIATIAGGLAVVWNLFGQVYSAVKYTATDIYGYPILYGGEARWHFVLRHSFSVIPFLCWVAVSWIVYKGIPQAAGKERVSEIGVAQG